MKELIEYAKSFLGAPYVFGGASPQGWDCSEFVQEILRSVGCDPKGDQTAQVLYDYFLLNGNKSTPVAGALCFYGKSTERITHIAFMINDFQIIEAGGGDSTTTSVAEAARKGAFVRIRPYDFRQDLIAILIPKYRSWVLNG